MSDQDTYGPPLPPQFSNQVKNNSNIHRPEASPILQSKSANETLETCGPELPPNFKKSSPISDLYGPVIPPHFSKNTESSKELYGPELPPTLIHSNTYTTIEKVVPYVTVSPSDIDPNICGPPLPPGFKKSNDVNDPCGPELPPKAQVFVACGPPVPPGFNPSNQETKVTYKRDLYGPEMPPGFQKTGIKSRSSKSSSSDEDNDDDYGTIGPLIPGAELKEELRHWKPDAKASNRPGGSLDGGELRREAWMTELPTPRKEVLGLQARKFRPNAAPVDAVGRQAWLATPGEEAAEQDDVDQSFNEQKEDFYRQATRSRDAEMEKRVEEYNKKTKRGESMMDIHNKKRKKKEEKKRKKEKKRKQRSRSRSFSPSRAVPRRQAFNRDEDLSVSQMDSASKKAFIAHSRSLSSKFAPGEQKYL